MSSVEKNVLGAEWSDSSRCSCVKVDSIEREAAQRYAARCFCIDAAVGCSMRADAWCRTQAKEGQDVKDRELALT